MRRTFVWWGTLAVGLGLVSCGPKKGAAPAGTQPSAAPAAPPDDGHIVVEEVADPDPTPSLVFPRPEELAELVSKQVGSKESTNVVDVATWKLSPPLRSVVDAEPIEARNGWDRMAVDIAHAKGAVATASMRCMAHQLSAFFLTRTGEPPEDLLDFMRARCGADVGSLGFGLSKFEADSRVSDAAVLEHNRARLSEWLRDEVHEGDEIGIWFARDKDLAVFAVAQGRAELSLDSPVRVVAGSDGNVHIAGRILKPVDSIHAIVNQGRLGVARCTDDGLILPEFSVRCPTLATDDSAWIEVEERPEGRFLDRRILALLAFPRGKSGDTWTRPSLALSADSKGEANERFLHAINEVRDAANFGRIHEVKEESARATKLAPVYFRSLHGSGDVTDDTVALGLLAGWEVDMPIRYGTFASGWTVASRDPEHALASILSLPSGRTVVLDPDATLIAIGLAPVHGSSVTGILLTSWAPAAVESEDTRAREVAARLARIRQERKRAPVALVGTREDSAAIAELVEKGNHSERTALRAFLRLESTRNRVRMHGWVIDAQRLDEMQFPPDLEDGEYPEIAISVAWHKPADEPWGHYAVFVAMTGD